MDEDANTLKVRLEYALVITFLYGQTYDCNEHCKYYKNIENAHYKFIPMVNRTHYDGSVSHVTGIVNITAEDYEAMPPRFDGEWLRGNFPGVAESMDRFIDKIKEETHGRDPRRPRDRPDPAGSVPRAQRDEPAVAHSGARRPPVRQLTSVPRRRLGDRLAVLPVDFAGLRVRDVPGGAPRAADLPLRDMLDRYELYIYKQWLRVYMRSKMIKHNKDLFESLDNPLSLLNNRHIY